MKRATEESIQRALRECHELPNRVVESIASPMVTVRVVTYNHADYIDRCIEGVLMQKTDFPFELVIGEDCSTDGTREKVLAHAERHPTLIRVITSDRNVGAKANVLRIQSRMRGRYIAILDGDDYWTDPCKLQTQVSFMEGNPGYVVTYHDFLLEDMESGRVEPSPLSDGDRRDVDDHTLRARDIWIQTNTMCYRNVLDMSAYPEYLQILNGDAFIVSLLGEHGMGKWLGDSIRPSVYRQHAGGIWSGLDDTEKIATQMHSYFWIGRYHLRKGDHEMAAIWKRKVRALVERGLPLPDPGAGSEHRSLAGHGGTDRGRDRKPHSLWRQVMGFGKTA